MLKDYVSAVSVGVINGTPMLDLPYIEDRQAMTDMNVAMTGSGEFIEIQGTAEHRPFNRAELNTLLDLAEKATRNCRPHSRLRSHRTETDVIRTQADRRLASRTERRSGKPGHVRQADINEVTNSNERNRNVRIIVATHNEGKLVEINRILEDCLGADADQVERFPPAR